MRAGSWFRVDSGWFMHPKMLGLADDAIAAWFRCLGYCSMNLTDGHVPAGAGRLVGTPESMEALTVAGLIDVVEDGWEVHDYLEHQRSRRDADEKRAADRERQRAARERKAVEKAKQQQAALPPAPLEMSQRDTGRDSRRDSVASPRVEERRGEERREEKRRTSCSPEVSDTPDRFTEFWSMYPRKVGKQAAMKAWAKAVKKHQPDVILEGLRKHLPAMAAKVTAGEPQFVPHPSTWLSQQRWDDELEPVPVVAPPMGAVAESPATGEPMRFEGGRWWIIRHNQRVPAETLPESWRVA